VAAALRKSKDNSRSVGSAAEVDLVDLLAGIMLFLSLSSSGTDNSL